LITWALFSLNSVDHKQAQYILRTYYKSEGKGTRRGWSSEMDCNPQSVFNTQSEDIVKYLEQYQKDDTRDDASQLQQYQVDAVLQLRRYFNKESQINRSNSNIGIVVLPTGCDSNGVAVMAAYALNASRVLVLTPSLVAAKQVYKSFSTFLLDCGVIKGKDKHFVPSKSVVTSNEELNETMATNVTIFNASRTGGKCSVRINDIPSINNNLVIIHEAQYYPVSTWQLIANHFSTSQLLFLSTTSQYNDRPILKDVHPCYELYHSEAVNRGVIQDLKFDKLVGGDDNYAYLVS